MSLVLRNVTKTYENGFQAVRNFNLEIRDKEFLIFVGPSGCGKSTLLRMIAGLEEISDGELWINDKLMNYVEAKDRGLSMVFQNYALYPYMNVYENIAFSLNIRKVPKAETDRRVKETARILGLDDLLKRRPKDLSGGQKQRVAIGNAIIRNPDVLLMDEPLSNLDAKLRGQMRVEFSRLHKQLNNTIIYVTHDQTEAMTLGTRIVVMKDGIIQQVDTPANLYNYPANLFVAGFIGSPAMNVLDVEVQSNRNETYLIADRFAVKVNESFRRIIRERGCTDLIMGIRPEDIYEKEEYEKAENNIIQAVVTGRELLGAEVILYFRIGEAACSAKVRPGCRARVGDTIKLALDMDKIHLFNRQTKENIWREK